MFYIPNFPLYNNGLTTKWEPTISQIVADAVSEMKHRFGIY